MAVTHKQIAERLGVSPQLVGLALNGHPRVSDVTRARIEETARELGYKSSSNHGARALAASRYGKRLARGIIAVMSPLIEGTPLRSIPHFIPMLDGVEIEATQRGLDIFLCSVRPSGLPRLIEEGDVDGVIGLAIDAETVRCLHDRGLPVVTLGNRCPGTEDLANAYSLMPDHHKGMRLSVEYLISQGHRRIAYVSQNLNYLPAQERLAGYRQALNDNGIAIEEKLIGAGQNMLMTDGARVMQELLERDSEYAATGRPGFTAIACYNDLMAMGAVQRAEEMGLKVPATLSVAAYDDISMQYGFRPALTSINFPRLEMGKHAVQLLCDSIASSNGSVERAEQPADLRHKVFPVELVVRDSVRPVGAAEV